MKGPKWVWFLVNSVFGILITEMEIALKSFRTTADFMNLQARRQNDKYEDLTLDEKKIVKQFFDALEEKDSFALKMIHLESSVQLTFYFTLLTFTLHDVPLFDLLNMASVKWILGLIWLILKTMLSGYSTFAPILRILKKDCYRLTAASPRITQYICLTINTLLDLWFAAGITFLGGSYHKSLE